MMVKFAKNKAGYGAESGSGGTISLMGLNGKELLMRKALSGALKEMKRPVTWVCGESVPGQSSETSAKVRLGKWLFVFKEEQEARAMDWDEKRV